MKKKNTGLIVVLIIFIVLTLLLGAYITYDKLLVKDTEEVSNKEVINNEEEPEEIKPEKITLAEVDELLDDYNNLAILLLNQKSSLNELTNQEKVFMASEIYKKNKQNVTSFTASDLALSYFIAGSFENENIYDPTLEETTYLYDSDSNTYEINENIPAHGGVATIPAITYDYDFYEEDGNYILIRYGVFYILPGVGPSSDEYYGKYKDIDLDNPQNNVLFKNPYEFESADWELYDPIDEIKENFEKYENEMTKFTYTFQKIDGKIMLIDYKAE